MEKVILIGGGAGQGTARTSSFFGKVFCNLGHYVFNYRDYPSLIRGGHNFNVLRISDKPVFSHKSQYDVIVALDQKTIDIHQKNLKKDGIILGNKDLKAKKLFPLDIDSILEKLGAPRIMENNVLAGYLFKCFGLPFSLVFQEAQKEFGEKSQAIKGGLEQGYNLAVPKESFKKKPRKNCFISGSEAVGVGALLAGIDSYIAYPMTPATPVLHWLAGRQKENNILVLQLENEIAVINAALGASFSGAKTMVGTSGGGFALMTEAMSMQGISEIPLVVYFAQRTGPATGLPTYTGQSDLKFAVNAGHGEFPRVVVAPGDPQEAIWRTQEAFYLSQKYRVLSIIISDKHLAESDYSFDSLTKSPVSYNRFILEKPGPDYKSYKITFNGVSPRAVPGQGPIVRGTSYEHNEYGNTIEDADWTIKMNDKRLKKTSYLEKETKEFNPVSLYGKGRNLLIGWGSTKGAILDSLSELRGFRFLQISYIAPFPADIVKKEILKSEKVILIENNATGLLADIIAEKTGQQIKNKILKYDARPFTPEFIINKILKL